MFSIRTARIPWFGVLALLSSISTSRAEAPPSSSIQIALTGGNAGYRELRLGASLGLSPDVLLSLSISTIKLDLARDFTGLDVGVDWYPSLEHRLSVSVELGLGQPRTRGGSVGYGFDLASLWASERRLEISVRVDWEEQLLGLRTRSAVSTGLALGVEAEITSSLSAAIEVEGFTSSTRTTSSIDPTAETRQSVPAERSRVLLIAVDWSVSEVDQLAASGYFVAPKPGEPVVSSPGLGYRRELDQNWNLGGTLSWTLVSGQVAERLLGLEARYRF